MIRFGAWNAHLQFDVATGMQVMALTCRTGDRMDVWRADGTMRTIEEATSFDRFDLPVLPMEALVAIRDAVDAAIGKRVPEQLVDILREVLTHERSRVDDVLRTLVADTRARSVVPRTTPEP